MNSAAWKVRPAFVSMTCSSTMSFDEHSVNAASLRALKLAHYNSTAKGSTILNVVFVKESHLI